MELSGQRIEGEGNKQAASDFSEDAEEGSYSINDEVTINTENGETKATIQNITEDGIEFRTEEPINGKKVHLVSQEEFDNMLVNDETNGTQEQTAEQTPVPDETQTTEETTPEDKVVTPEEQVTTPETEVQQEEQNAPKQASAEQETALSRIPKDEKGEPIYEQTDASTAWDGLIEQTEGDEEMAHEVAEDMVKEKTADLEKAEKEPISQGKTPAEKIAARKAHKAKIEQAKQELEHWKAIANVQAERKAETEQQEAEKAKAEEAKEVAEAKAEETKKVDEGSNTQQESEGKQVADKDPSVNTNAPKEQRRRQNTERADQGNDNVSQIPNDKEAEEIVAKAKADGTYMKAPNGKPSELSPKQWVQVRTNAFKNWFGDWEKAAKWNMIETLNATPIVDHVVSEEEAQKAYDHIGQVENAINGKKVDFVKNAFGKIIRHKGVDVKIIMDKMPTLFNESIPLFFEEEIKKDGHKDHSSNFVGYHHYLNKISIDGKEYYVRFTAQEVRTNPSKKKGESFTPYQFHSSSISDIAIYENMEGSVESTGTYLSTGANHAYVDTKLANFLKDAKDSYENSSKVVDENSEPRVVDGHFMALPLNA